MSPSVRQLFNVSLGMALFLAGCSKQSNDSAAPRASADPAITRPAVGSSENFESTLPQVHPPGGYVGSAACRSCHEDQYSSWHQSYHRTMTQVASDESVQADFDDVVLTSGTTRFTLQKRSGEYWVRMEPLVSATTEGLPPAALEQRLGLVTGSHHMQVFWVPSGDGNVQLGFPFTWLIPEKRWVPRNSTFIRPPDLQHHSEVWNVVCSRCHTTGVKPHVDFATRSAQTEVVELGISCEACHGPGEKHVNLQKASSGRKKVEPGEIVQPRKLPAERSAQVCGFCHSMKWIDKSSDWRANGFAFRPGDDLEQTTPVIRPSAVDSIAGLKQYLSTHPDVLQDFFWPDGMIRVSGREYNGLIESPCFKGGRFSCVTCHSLHDSDPDDQLAVEARGNRACLQCHQEFQDPSALQAHSRHSPSSSGSDCYNCHMPHTTYGILSSIRSHQISSPRVADDVATGRPNACNLCHLDKTLSWTAQYLEAWYAQKAPVLPAESTAVSQVVQLAIAGDAGQRALAAWHLGWAPALQASSSKWIEPLLATLLDDPYAAVRCLAVRSFNSNGFLVPATYDFALDPQERPPVRGQIWSRWEKASAAPEKDAAVLIGTDHRFDQETFERLLQKRNARPVRLRE